MQACGGEALTQAKTLQDAGLSRSDAQQITQDLARAEAGLAPAVRKRMDSFGSTVRMDAAGQHPAPGPASSAAPGARDKAARHSH